MQLDQGVEIVELDVGAAIQLVQAMLPGMRERRFGRIVLISSRAALGAATRTVYSATKAALLGLARTWALELAADGITVNVVAPGPIRTDMYRAIVPAGSEQDQRLAASIPVGRIGEAGDVARAVAFFAAPANGFVTGQTLFVWPVTKPFAGAAKKATARATSPVSPIRPTGIDAARRWSCSLPAATMP